jgi:hypothetical protein
VRDQLRANTLDAKQAANEWAGARRIWDENHKKAATQRRERNESLAGSSEMWFGHFYISHLDQEDRDRIKRGDFKPREIEMLAKGEDPWGDHKPLPAGLEPPAILPPFEEWVRRVIERFSPVAEKIRQAAADAAKQSTLLIGPPAALVSAPNAHAVQSPPKSEPKDERSSSSTRSELDSFWKPIDEINTPRAASSDIPDDLREVLGIPRTAKARRDAELLQFMPSQLKAEYDKADAKRRAVLLEANERNFEAAQKREEQRLRQYQDKTEKTLDMLHRIKEDPSKAHLLPPDDASMDDLHKWHDEMSKPIRTIPFLGEGGYTQTEKQNEEASGTPFDLANFDPSSIDLSHLDWRERNRIKARQYDSRELSLLLQRQNPWTKSGKPKPLPSEADPPPRELPRDLQRLEQLAKGKFRIFLSYRRDDTSGHAGRLSDRLSDHFGEDQLFMDINTITPGEDFVDAIEAAISSCDVLIAVIGRNWLDATDPSGKRLLDNPEDFVRIEIAAALKRNIRVIPVLVDSASMPRSEQLPDTLVKLARRNAIELSGVRWKHDVGRLIEAIETAIGPANS